MDFHLGGKSAKIQIFKLKLIAECEMWCDLIRISKIPATYSMRISKKVKILANSRPSLSEFSRCFFFALLRMYQLYVNGPRSRSLKLSNVARGEY